jgi:hypothetical protein
MKTKFFLALGVTTAALGFYACQRNVDSASRTVDEVQSKKPSMPEILNCANYSFDATISYGGGKTTVIWSVTNTNPGNGSNGTSQNLSHWDWVLPSCIEFGKVLNAYYTGTWSPDFEEWTPFTPTNVVDPSQTCNGGNVIKFNFGTSGSNTSYYAIVLDGTNYSLSNDANAVAIKAGNDCCTKNIEGVVCDEQIPTCAWSQGYFFSKPGVIWCGSGSVTFGAYPPVTQQQGTELWPAQGSVMKKAFFQAATLQLNQCMGNLISPDLQDEYTFLSDLLAASSLAGITAGTIPAGYNSADIEAAAQAIGTWIAEHHCEGDIIVSQ